ncbi:MAG: 4Fe-4S dicluster domain-containing protein [Bacteroidales bacterium]|nr:4Fe-4S dicluster domain-containing protein [Bacteroidales bacterium]
MINFGFSINATRSIDYDSLKRDKANKVAERVPSFRLCIGCGACTGACTAGQFCDFNIRRCHTSMSRGKYDDLEEKMRNCMLCGKCTLACPRGVNLRSLIINMRRTLHE